MLISYKTTNAGATWNFQYCGTDYNFKEISFYGANQGVVVGDYGSIFKTDNGGQTTDSLLLLPKILNLSYLAGSKSTFKIITNRSWNLNNPSTWASSSKYNGTGNDSVMITAGINISGSPRTALIIINVGGLSSDTVTVIQQAKPTGTNENIGHMGFTIYPNPTNGLFTIENAKGCQLTIFNSLGKTIYNGIVNDNSFTTDLNNLTDGIYFLKLERNGSLMSKKIVLRR